MKWIGQHIWDFISRFRSDVYLEDLADPGSDTDKFLVVDTNNKVGYRTGAEVLSDIGASSESSDLEFNGSTANGILTYGGAAQIDVESQLTYDNAANSQIFYDTHPSGSFNSYLLDIDVTSGWATGSNAGYGFSQFFDKNANTASGSTNSYTGFKSEIHDTGSDNDGNTILTGLFQDIDFSNNNGDGVLTVKGLEQTLNYGDYQYGMHTTIRNGSDAAGKTFGIYQDLADGSNDLRFVSSANPNDYFNIATGANGATAITTVDNGGTSANLDFDIGGSVTFDTPGLTVTDTVLPILTVQNSTANNTGGTLRLQNTSGGSAPSDSYYCGYIEFYGMDDSPSTHQYGKIYSQMAHVQDGAEAGAMMFDVAADGGLRRGITIDGDNASQKVDVTIGNTTSSTTTIEGDLTTLGDDISMSSASSGKPLVELKTTNTTKTTSAELQFKKDATDTEDGEVLGKITWYGENEAGSPENIQFAEIVGSISESDDGDEAGILEFKVAESDDSTSAMTTGLKLEGEHATDGEIDVTIGAGVASTTTIAGTLTMGSTAAMTNAGQLSVAAQPNITTMTGFLGGTANALITDDGDGTVTSETNLYFVTNPSFSFFSELYIGSTDGGESVIKKVSHDNGVGGDLVIKAGSVDSGGSNTDLDGGDLKFYTGIPTGTGDFGNFQFYAGDTQTSSGTANHPNSKIAQLESNGATSTDFTLYEQAGTTTADYFKIAVAEHGATTLSTWDDSSHAANLTFNIDGFTKFTSPNTQGGGVEIENASASGAPALLIDNDDADQSALKIEAANTTVAIIDVDGSSLTYGPGIRITDDTYERAAGHINIVATDTATTTIDRGGNGLLKVDYNRPSGSSVASAQTVSAIGAEIRMDDNATNNLGNTSITGLDVHCDFANSGSGINTAIGIVTRVGGGDVNQDIKMINDADDSEYAIINVATGGELGIRTFSDDATGDINISADGDITLTSGTDHHNSTSIKRRKMTVTADDTHHDHDGDVVYFGAADGSVSQGDICYLGKDGSNNATWFRAQANAESTSTSLLAICLGTDPATDGMLLRGMFTLDENTGDNNFGSPVYLSDAGAGEGVVIPPADNNDVVRVIGYKMGNNDEIWFCPDNTWVVVTA